MANAAAFLDGEPTAAAPTKPRRSALDFLDSNDSPNDAAGSLDSEQPPSRAASIVPTRSVQTTGNADVNESAPVAVRPALPTEPGRGQYDDAHKIFLSRLIADSDTPAGMLELKPAPASLFERLAGGFKQQESLSQNLGGLLLDRIPRLDPATGQLLSEAENRANRLDSHQRRVDALGIEDPTTIPQLLAGGAGAMVKEGLDPLAVVTVGVGQKATGLKRLAKLAGAGGAYAAVAASLDQLAHSGEITSVEDILKRGATGALAVPVLDALFRGIGLGIRKLLALRRAASPDAAPTIDEEIQAGVQAAQEEAAKHGIHPDQARQRLFDIAATPEGDVAVPSRELFQLPSLANGAEVSRETGLMGGEPPVTAAPGATGPTADQAVANAGRQRANFLQLADEYDRLARATTDPTVRTELLQKATSARQLAANVKPRLTPTQRIDQARRVDPTRDSLDVAIRKLGGIDTQAETDWAGRLLDVPRMFGLPGLERPGKGKSLDALAERLFELGYLSNYDQTELADLLARVERGETIYSPQASDAAFNGLEPPRATDRDYIIEPDAVDPAAAGKDFTIDTDSGSVVTARPIDYADLLRLEQEEAHARAWHDNEAAGSAEGSGGLPENGGGGVSNRLADTPGGRPGDQPEPRAQTGNVDYTFGTNERDAADVQQPGSAGYRAGNNRRGSETVPGQLDLFLRDGDAAADAVAAFDSFGARVKYTTTGKLPSGLRQVTNAADVAHITAPLRKEPQEAVLAVVTDDAGNVLRVIRHTVGTRDASQVDPGLLAAAAHSTPGGRQVWFIHQHPSGNPVQSPADKRMTEVIDELLRDTGVTPRGMVVVTPGGRFSHFAPAVGSTDPERIPAAVRTQPLDVSERRFARSTTESSPVDSPPALRAAMDQYAGGREGILLLDTQGKPVGFVPMTADDMMKLRQGGNSPAARLYRALDETNASSTAAIIESPDLPTLERVHGNLNGFAKLAHRNHMDTLNADGVSAAERGLSYTPTTFYANPFNEALKFGVQTLRNNTARAVPGGLAGGMVGGAESEHEPGSAKWWVDVGFGAAAGAFGAVGGFKLLQRAHITGKGGIADRGLDLAGEKIGKLLGRGPAELEEMKRLRANMRELLDRQTGEIGTFLRDKFTPSERALMADLIEGRGIVPDLNRIHTQAKALDDYLTFISQRMKEYGMLPKDVAEGGYLHRYYAKHLGLDASFKEAKRQSLSGSYTIARGTVDTFRREFLSPGAGALADRMDELLRERSLLERGMFEKAARMRGESDLKSGRVAALPDEAILRPPPNGAPPPTMSIDDAVRRMSEIDDLLKQLRGTELVEMVGEQGGRPRSFFFTRDEVGRVTSDPVLARLFKGEKPASPTTIGRERQLEAPLLQPSPGRVGPELGATPAPALPDIKELSPTDRVWRLRNAAAGDVKLHRDWTRRERDSWGEIRDAGYRFVRGMAEASHDLSLGKFFHDVSKRADWVSKDFKTTKEGEWDQVPTEKARPGAGLERYGALAGKYVRPDVWRAIKRHGATPRVLGALGDVNVPLLNRNINDIYRSALSRWKLWHTVYNPVSHLNNTHSNAQMLYMGGYGPHDLARGLVDMARGEKSQYWREARDAGLLDTDFGTTTISADGKAMSVLESLAEEIRNQRDDDATAVIDAMMRVKEWWIGSRNAVTDAKGGVSTGLELARAAAKPLVAGLRFIKRPVDAAARSAQRLYRAEDNIFKLATFAAERRKGATIDAARKAADELFFDYGDLPDTVKIVRDFPIGSPFISYTYKAIPAVARNIVRHPERVLGLVLAYEAWNYSVLVHQGMDPDRYFETIDAYENTLPPWDSGRSLWGASNFLLMPGADNLLALGRAHALGNPFMSDAGERRGSIPGVTNFWGSDIFGSNPLHAVYDVVMNEDWKGKEIHSPGAPESAKRRAIAAYLYQSWAPSNILTPGSYHQTKLLEGLANEARKNPDGLAAPIVGVANDVASALGLQQFTGLDKMKNEIDVDQAALGSVGVKLRPINTKQSVDIQSSQLERDIQDKERFLGERAKLKSQHRITAAQFLEDKTAATGDIKELIARQKALRRARATLREQGLSK